MQKWSLSLRLNTLRAAASNLGICLVAALLALWISADVPAQIRIPAEALSSDTNVADVIRVGNELESECRWREALAHYEKAFRQHPERRDLKECLTRARSRFDLQRRYNDESFTSSLTRLTERQALDLYTEVLTKVETHYVAKPDWHGLTQRGVENLNAALSTAAFQRYHLPDTPVVTIQAFREKLQRRMAVTVVHTRQEATEVAANVAKLAQQHLRLSPSATVMEFTCGATCALDQYSSFLTPGQLEDVFSQIEGNFVGLGIELKPQDKALLIVSVIPGSPAEQAGIRAGEQIIEVDGVATAEVSGDHAANLLKGSEGSIAQVKIVDTSGIVRSESLLRRRVEVPSVQDARIVDSENGIAYLRITSFQKTTSRDIDATMWRLHRDGMQCLIIDVRGNPGGLLTASVDLADKFVSAGNLVSTRGRSAREDFDYPAHTVGTWRVPLFVLIDGDTASASEIFAGAIRDHHRGTVVGQRSYGKGSVQGIFRLNTTDVGVRLTTAKFYSPSGQAISNRGVSPDVAVHVAAKPVVGADVKEQAEDLVLNQTLQLARDRFLSQRQASR